MTNGSTSEAWTPETVARLKELVGDGVTFEEIGKRMGVTKNMVIGKARRAGFKRRADATLSREQLNHAGGRDARPVPTLFDRLDALNVFAGARCCVYPIGHPRTDGFRFCAQRTDEVASYCPDHFGHRVSEGSGGEGVAGDGRNCGHGVAGAWGERASADR